MRTWKIVARITAAAGLALGGILITSPNALAAGCSGYTCAGHDPVVYGCSLTSTKTLSDSFVTVWNRYSSGCNANWGRAQLSTSAYNAGDTLEVAIWTTDSHGSYEAMCFPGPSNTGQLVENCNSSWRGSGTAYTDMVDGTNTTYAQAIVLDSNGLLVDQSPVVSQ